jgi:hypothetical protein
MARILQLHGMLELSPELLPAVSAQKAPQSLVLDV